MPGSAREQVRWRVSRPKLPMTCLSKLTNAGAGVNLLSRIGKEENRAEGQSPAIYLDSPLLFFLSFP
jgi:hypothetical protein